MMPRAAAVVLFALFAVGLAFATSLEALRPLCGGRKPTLVSNARTIHGTRGPDVIVGGRGPNEIFGGGGNDVVCAGYGRDVVHGGLGKDTLDGKRDADRVSGGRGSDEVDGGSGRDRVRGDSGNDKVRGGPGTRDQVDGGMGDDFVDGGPGPRDLVSYMNAGGPISVDLKRGRVTGAERERLVEIEDVLTAPEVSRGGSRGTQVELRRGLPGSAGLAITGGEGGDVVAVSFQGGSFVVSGGSVDSVQLGAARFTDRCSQLGAAVSCAAHVTSIHVDLGAGDDLVSLDRSVPAGVAVVIDGGPGSDSLRGGTGGDTIYAGDDADPDRLEGGGGNDVLFGVNILHPRRPSGAATLAGGGGDDLLIGGQPCEGDLFAGGRGRFDSASFARVRNSGTVVKAQIGGRVIDPGVGECTGGRIAGSTEKIEGSTGRDILAGSAGADVLLGRGGPDRLDGRGGEDRCIGGRARDGARRCEYVR
jgi:Ca2+-binding RTX toxin-like protein